MRQTILSHGHLVLQGRVAVVFHDLAEVGHAGRVGVPAFRSVAETRGREALLRLLMPPLLLLLLLLLLLPDCYYLHQPRLYQPTEAPPEQPYRVYSADEIDPSLAHRLEGRDPREGRGPVPNHVPEVLAPPAPGAAGGLPIRSPHRAAPRPPGCRSAPLGCCGCARPDIPDGR